MSENIDGMGRKRTRLVMSAAQQDELRGRLRVARDAREKERLRWALKAASGDYTLEDLAGLLDRDTPPGSISPVAAPDIQAQLRAGLEAGRWHSAGEVAAWLKETHGIQRAPKSVYYWLAKNRLRENHQPHC